MNSEPWGIFLLGELFQNNHHKFGKSANFAQKWFEWDPTYTIMKIMHFIRIIKLKPIVVPAKK
jgi:stearoyl-CoA desaturase (delta-9 desaturase)